MSYQEVMDTILPPSGRTAPHITGHFGEHREGKPKPHGGSDFNYVGGQSGKNLTHPEVHSPISGEVTFVGGQYGTIKIRDADGNSHELLHTSSQSVKVGQHVNVGDDIGTMGGQGPGKKGDHTYAQHVHYQIKDKDGKLVNPEEYWKNRSPGGPSHASPHGERAHPGTMRAGDHGDDVKTLQEKLNKLGYHDENGKPLVPDGKFGDHTKAAVERFQKDHHLDQDGIVGKNTLKALDGQEKTAPRLDDKAHPHNPVYDGATKATDRLDEKLGRTPDEQSQRLAGAATAAAVKGGLTHIDHIVMNEDGSKGYAVQGELNSPLKKVAEFDVNQALATPLEKSSEAAMQTQTAQSHAQVQSQAQSQQQQQQQQQQQSVAR
ncbi:peptidoglycan-binding protein [Luteibacter aegosomatis]|uniref:XVIPCD domain-containing protein n=1 Tax=Luteibacter aegosomatis TaxID=2911537 RepID=UPI001FFA28CC|nr:XVIPCD domain-containing protein [Luteibacter aegosomatis]UPG84682.1 peptidoglycan-binding protein [Luteibacter aegosomatis]